MRVFMVSLASHVMRELLPWTHEMASPGTDFSRCFEGAEEKHEETPYPESESALEKEGPSERQDECFSQVVLWSLRPTSCTVVHMCR